MSWYRELSHTADTGIETEAGSLPEVISAAARAMFHLMYGGIEGEATRQLTFEVRAPTCEELLYDVLAELLWRSEAEEVAVSEIRVEVEDAYRARVEARGAPFDEVELAGPPIKAVTYHDLVCRRCDGDWYARVVFDV